MSILQNIQQSLPRLPEGTAAPACEGFGKTDRKGNPMKEIITIANQKGGVGKSTTAHALGSCLRAQGERVLFIDLDPQGNLSYTMEAEQGGPTAYELLTKQADIASCIRPTGQGDLLPASAQLAGADMELSQTGKEYRLKEALQPLCENYDYILIDTPPALGILTVNALTASDSLLIPAQADIYSLQGIGQLYATVQAVRTYCNHNLTIKGILLTRYSSRTVLSRDLTEMISETAAQLGTKVYATVIRENIAVKEAQARRADLLRYAPKSNAAKDYDAFTKEFTGGSVQ